MDSDFEQHGRAFGYVVVYPNGVQPFVTGFTIGSPGIFVENVNQARSDVPYDGGVRGTPIDDSHAVKPLVEVRHVG